MLLMDLSKCLQSLLEPENIVEKILLRKNPGVLVTVKKVWNTFVIDK